MRCRHHAADGDAIVQLQHVLRIVLEPEPLDVVAQREERVQEPARGRRPHVLAISAEDAPGDARDQHDHVGATDRSKRLAHRPRRQHPAISQAARAVDQHQIHVALEPQMLKCVVEYHRVERTAPHQQLDPVEPPPRHRDRSAERLRHHRRFVACLFSRDQQLATVRNQRRWRGAASPAVTPAHDSNI